MKRLIDIILSACGLVFVFPLFAIVSVLIKIDSSGPVFFRQTRVGRYGIRFKIIKFRTMHNNPSKNELQITVGSDGRVTKIGRFLRKYKIDELPQLINVINGEMSLVGPRPEVPRYVDYYPDDVRSIVLSVRPGITDKASIEFRNESMLLGEAVDPLETYVKEILPAKLKHNLDYVNNRSLSGDFIIIANTVRVLFW